MKAWELYQKTAKGIEELAIETGCNQSTWSCIMLKNIGIKNNIAKEEIDHLIQEYFNYFHPDNLDNYLPDYKSPGSSAWFSCIFFYPENKGNYDELRSLITDVRILALLFMAEITKHDRRELTEKLDEIN